MFDDILQAEDRVDNILCNDICWCCLCSKQDRHLRIIQRLAGLDLASEVQIVVDAPQKVHLLPLVLVQTLCLDIEYGVRIDLDIPGVLQILRKTRLVAALDGHQIAENLLVIRILPEFLQLLRMADEVIPDLSGNVASKLRIAGEQPSAEGNPVRLVVELLRIDVVEISQLRLLEDLRVKFRNTVDRLSIMDINMRHVYRVIFINDHDRRIVILSSDTIIQCLNDRYQLWNNLLQIGNGPLFKRFRQDCVIRVRRTLRDNGNSLILADASLLQQPDHLRNDHGRMRIIDLEDCVIRQIMQVAASCDALVQDQLRTVADHEVLLIDAKLASVIVGIVRIQEQGQVLCDISLVKINSIVDDAFVNRVQVEQMQRNGLALVSCHIQIIERGMVGLPGHGHIVAFGGLHFPSGLLQPRIRLCFLLMIHEFLTEQSQMIVQPNAAAVQVQRCDGIQEAGSQTAKSAISERRLLLDLLDCRDILAVLLQKLPRLIEQSQIDQIIREQLTN